MPKPSHSHLRKEGSKKIKCKSSQSLLLFKRERGGEGEIAWHAMFSKKPTNFGVAVVSNESIECKKKTKKRRPTLPTIEVVVSLADSYLALIKCHPAEPWANCCAWAMRSASCSFESISVVCEKWMQSQKKERKKSAFSSSSFFTCTVQQWQAEWVLCWSGFPFVHALKAFAKGKKCDIPATHTSQGGQGERG